MIFDQNSESPYFWSNQNFRYFWNFFIKNERIYNFGLNAFNLTISSVDSLPKRSWRSKIDKKVSDFEDKLKEKWSEEEFLDYFINLAILRTLFLAEFTIL